MVVQRLYDGTIKATFIDSLLFPYNYSFGGGSVLNEISACRFVNESHVALVGDSGELFFASVRADDALLDITLLSRVPLKIPGLDHYVDAEGVEVFAKYEDSLLISSETPLALTWFDRSTGMAQNDSQRFPTYKVPEFVLEKTKTNKGFEALTNFSSSRLGVIGADDSITPTHFLLTTTEGALDRDPVGYHRFLIWDTQNGGDPLVELGHWASRWKETGNHNEFLAISDMDYWDDQELLLVLERGYDGTTNMIRLWAVDLGFPVTRNRQLLLNWTLDTLQLTDADAMLQVDNYEAVCMFPSSKDKNKRRLLLVNDDNHNPNQIGTQFVLLELELSVDSEPNSKSNSSLCETNGGCTAASKPTPTGAIVILSLVLGFLVLSVIYRRLRRSPVSLYKEQVDSEILNNNDLELI